MIPRDDRGNYAVRRLPDGRTACVRALTGGRARIYVEDQQDLLDSY